MTVIDAPVDDFWMRDIMPTFALREGVAQEVVAIDWNFNGWGGTVERLLTVYSGAMSTPLPTASYTRAG